MANWIQKAIKPSHEGILTAAAKRHGVSVHQEAEKEANSSSKKLRGRGALALRFEKGGDLHR